MTNAKRDENRIPSLLGIDPATGNVVPVSVDPLTGAMYVTDTGGAGRPYDAENATGSITIDFSTVSDVILTLTGNVTAIAITPPTIGANRLIRLSVRLLQDGTGGRTVAGWPASVKWAGGSAPTITATAGKYDIITFDHDGTNYSAVSSQNF